MGEVAIWSGKLQSTAHVCSHTVGPTTLTSRIISKYLDTHSNLTLHFAFKKLVNCSRGSLKHCLHHRKFIYNELINTVTKIHLQFLYVDILRRVHLSSLTEEGNGSEYHGHSALSLLKLAFTVHRSTLKASPPKWCCPSTKRCESRMSAQ